MVISGKILPGFTGNGSIILCISATISVFAIIITVFISSFIAAFIITGGN